MFGKKNKKEVENNPFGDLNYQMKKEYNANELLVANFQRISSDVTDFGPMVETTEQKYIFEKIIIEEELKYRELFTGFIANDKEESFDLPYIVNPIPFIDILPETAEEQIPKLSLIWILNDINRTKIKDNTKQLKR